MAVTSSTGLGVWQYEMSGVWLNVPSTLSDASVLLLPSSALLRFDPTVDQAGTATLSWYAWDGTQGTAGQTFALNETPGGATAFSTASATLTIPVESSSQPIWNGSSATLTPVAPGTPSTGDTVASVFGSSFQDTPGIPVGIAITGLSGTASGTWQYQLEGSSTWNSIGTVSASQALLLSAEDLIRFVPGNATFLGTVSLTAHAWDGSTGAHGSKARVQGSDFSSTTLTAVCLVNTAPTLTN